MTNRLSDWARAFLREDHVAVVSTLNTDGSPPITTIWYVLQEDASHHEYPGSHAKNEESAA